MDVPVGPMMADTTIIRRLGAALLGLIDRVLPCRLEVVTDEPPPNTHDVAVDRIGVQVRLRIGDRAVRLDRGDARYLGELLSCGWVGQLNDVHAADER